MIRWMFVIASAATTIGSGCAYYTAHALVPTNIRAADAEALTAGPTRVEAQVCGNRLLSIPFGPDPTMDALVRALEEQTDGSAGLEDIRIDHVSINYLFVFSKDCVHGTARPLLATAKDQAPKRRGRVGPPTGGAEPVAPERPRPGSSVPSPADDPFAN
jgi:hypothetical protein